MERNSEIIKIKEDNQRVKSIDCKIMNTMLQDLVRYNTVLKVGDEDFIFLRRAINVKSVKSKEKKKANITDD